MLTFSAETEARVAATNAFAVTQGSTLNELSIAITAFLRSPSVNAGLGTVTEMITGADHVSLRGALTLYGNSAAIRNFRISSNRPVSGPHVAKAFAVPPLITAGAARMAVTTETLRAPAQSADPLGELYDADGKGLGLESGDVISFSGSLGNSPASDVSPLIYAEGIAGTAMRAVLDRIRDNFTPGLWLWSAQPGGQVTVVSGNRGRVSFGPDGSVSGFTMDGGATHLEFAPGSGEALVRIVLKAGGPGDFTGLTQFRTGASLLSEQNGFPAGTLIGISIGNDGIISGHYSNEASRPLFLIPLADFPNKQGLELIGGNTFLETRESGVPIISASSRNPIGVLAPGALEASPE